MDNEFSNICRCISILARLIQMYYNHGLSDFEIGWGQQFFVEYLYEHPGASAQDMVEQILVDKATLTKTVKKLLEIGYVKVIGDEEDKRIKHLYLTEKAIPAVDRIKRIHSGFYHTWSQNIAQTDIDISEQTMEQMIENISKKVWHRMENDNFEKR